MIRSDRSRAEGGRTIGSRAFKKVVAVEEAKARPGAKLTHEEGRAAKSLRWEALLEECLQVVGKDVAFAGQEPKAAAWKVAIAAFMKRRAMTTNAWLTEKLVMGTPAGVSRYASEAKAGARPGAEKLLKRLNTRIKQ